MAALRKGGTKTIVAMLAIAALALAFWLLLLGPQREEAAKLGDEVEQVEASLAVHRAEVAEAEEARAQFPVDYQKLVVLGKAVPGGDETPSLLVQVSGIAERSGVKFKDIELNSSGESATPAPAPPPGGEPVSATEASASLLPLGASVGPAGLAVMPYTLNFDGTFFQLADFIKGLDAMVKTPREEVLVDGRLLTIDGFSLAPSQRGFPSLTATFGVTTYLSPPSEAPDAGGSPGGAGGATATPAATRIGATR